jgi:hypothetical protein
MGSVILTALLRDRHGCPGPDRYGRCYWAQVVPDTDQFAIRRKPAPLYRGEDDDDDGSYL